MIYVLALVCALLGAACFGAAFVWWRAAYALGECLHRGVSMISLDYSTQPFKALARGFYPVVGSWGFVRHELDAAYPSSARVRLGEVEPTLRLYALIIFALAGLNGAVALLSSFYALAVGDSAYAVVGSVVGLLGLALAYGLFVVARRFFISEGVNRVV